MVLTLVKALVKAAGRAATGLPTSDSCCKLAMPTTPSTSLKLAILLLLRSSACTDMLMDSWP